MIYSLFSSNKCDRSTSIDDQLIRMFNLNLETNEILLSSIVNPYHRTHSSTRERDLSTIRWNDNGIRCRDVSICTGDDYPHWWTHLSTTKLLSDRCEVEDEEKNKFNRSSSPRFDQSIQTDHPSKQRLSSSSTTLNHYQIIDDSHQQRSSPRVKSSFFFIELEQKKRFFVQIDHRLNFNRSTLQIPSRNSSKQSDTGYNTFASSFTQGGGGGGDQSVHLHTEQDEQRQRLHSDTSSTTLIHQLFERYEKSLKDREENDLLQRYRKQRDEQFNPLKSTRVRRISLLVFFFSLSLSNNLKMKKKESKHFNSLTLQSLRISIENSFLHFSLRLKTKRNECD